MLEQEFNYYKENQAQLVKEYLNKFIVIVGENVVDSYDDEDVAYFESESKFGLGKFFIIRCEPGEESYTTTFHSRVILS